MGYRPNAMASMLAHLRHNRSEKPVRAALAWLNLWPQPGRLRAEHKEFDLYWQGALATAEKFGYHLDEITPDKGRHAESLERILVARGIQGILLPPVPDEIEAGWGAFHWDRFSVVRFGRSHKDVPCHLVTADQTADAMLAFDEIRSRGYRRIGAVMGIRKVRHLFDAGFLKAQLAVPESDRLPICQLTQGNAPANTPVFEKWFRQHRPDAIITDHTALLSLLKRMGLSVPKDIGLATTTVLDGNIDAGIYQNPEEIGRVGVLQLLSLMHDNERGIPDLHREVLVKGTWVDGGMLPRRKPAKGKS
jgi:DNA-binding LacI/PurR family transcriptional regulator